MTDRRRSRRFTRRRFLRLLGGTVAGGVAASVIDAFAVEPRWINVTCPTLVVEHLGAGWDGVRIAHLTDLHVGRLISLDHVRKAVDLANAAGPDLVVLTGDFVSRRRAINDALTDALKALRAPLGAFAVLGNHDHWTDAAAVVKSITAAGVRMLDNGRTVLTRGGDPLVLAGVGDLWEGAPDLGAALAGAPAEAPRVLLCHNPDYADRMPADPRVDLMLCGHTHGGQVKVPFGGRPQLPIRNLKYAAGFVPGPHCPMYVSVGLGMVGIPVRFNCRPELPVITLRRSTPA